MKFDKTLTSTLLITFCVVFIPALLYFRKPPTAAFTNTEKELSTFSEKPVTITSATPQTTFSGKVSPMTAPPKPVEIPIKTTPLPLKIKSVSRSLPSLPVVSMIYYAGYTKMAIVDGHVVNEGAELDGGVIAKIEKNRVLLKKAGKDIWLTTE